MVKGETNYMIKVKKNLSEEIQISVPLKQAKLKDFLLQKHFGKDWESDSQLTFQKEILDRNVENQDVEEEDPDGDFDETGEEILKFLKFC